MAFFLLHSNALLSPFSSTFKSGEQLAEDFLSLRPLQLRIRFTRDFRVRPGYPSPLLPSLFFFPFLSRGDVLVRRLLRVCRALFVTLSEPLRLLLYSSS